MARILEPRPGLIFRYGYLWLAEFRQGRLEPVKDRPACIAVRVADALGLGLSVVGAASVRLSADGVVILPITTQAPRGDQVGVELDPDEKRQCGLDPGSRSWVIVSEFNVDIWPNADMSIVPETGEFSYGIARPGLMARIGKAFGEARRARRLVGVKR